MEYYEKILVTIICESLLEDRIVDKAKGLGIEGHTVLEAHGEGGRGNRISDFEYNKNIKIEMVCSEETADQLCTIIRERYFDDYAVVIYRSHVEVMRKDKFV